MGIKGECLNDFMSADKMKIGSNALCPCGSGKKFKKCCRDKKPRDRTILLCSPEKLRGVYYDKDKMEFMGLALDDRLIKLNETFSQLHYTGESGKEKVISRVHDKVIPNEADLLRYLSSFDLIITVDTNTKDIEGETVSATGFAYCTVQNTTDPNKYHVHFRHQGAMLFKNCPVELSPEKFGWLTVMRNALIESPIEIKRFALVTDHDMDALISFNSKQRPIFRDFFLPNNFTLMYARGDGVTQNPLNYVVKICDKKATDILTKIEKKGYYKNSNVKLSIDQIPVPSLKK